MNIFNDFEIINQLETIIKNLKENEERKNMIFAYYLKTGLTPENCSCEEGLNRVRCKKCNGTGYILINKKDEQI